MASSLAREVINRRRGDYAGAVDLRLCPAGSAVEVRWLDLDDDERARMRELGIREGALLHVINCGAFGAKVVAIGSDRFAIDGRTCACIAVATPDANSAVVGSLDLNPDASSQPSNIAQKSKNRRLANLARGAAKRARAANR